MKDPKVSRIIYISLVVLLVAAAVVIGLVAAANRAKKPSVTDGPKPPVTDAPSDVTTVSPSTTVEVPATSPSDDTTAPVSPTASELPLPVFSLPAAGKLVKKHDAKVQVFSTTMNDYRVHLGVDIATAAGAPVYAAADGKISKIWKDALMGYCVAVSHDGGAVTVYKNLSDTLPDGIIEGASIKAGRQIASVGDSAMVEVAEEPHLHFEMTVDGIQVDPMEYYSASDVASLSSDTSYES